MALDVLAAAHPELQAALSSALDEVAAAGPSCGSPVRVAADALGRWSAARADGARRASPRSTTRRPSADEAAAGRAQPSVEEEAAEAKELGRQRAAVHKRGRRGVVFSEPVSLDVAWTPVLVDKTPAQRREIGAVLKQNFLFAGIDEDAERIIVDAMAPRACAQGEVIIKQGAPGDFYHVLSEGACDITVDGRCVLQARPGMGFGELALLYDAPRAASVTVTSPAGARTWALDRATFKQVMISTTMRKREAWGAFLKQVPLFGTLTQGERLIIADALQPLKVTAGERVVVQGDAHADRFYLVEEGELKAEIAGVPGEVCERLTRGAFFGERALIKDEPRAASVTAVVDSKCLAMDRAAFIRLLGPIAELLARSEAVYRKFIDAATQQHTAAATVAATGTPPSLAAAAPPRAEPEPEPVAAPEQRP